MKKYLPIVLLLPTLIAIAMFVYVFIGTSLFYSLTNWKSLSIDLSIREPFYQNYVEMFTMPRFQSDLRNMTVFTVLFLSMSMGLGLFLAIMLDRKVFARGFFRSVFLFPYALSFIVTGVVWRWIFNPETGLNLMFDFFGVNSLLTRAGLAPLKPGWTTDPEVWFSINSLLGSVWPGAAELQIEWGIPAALIPVAVAATWQLSGFVMAMYLGGLGSIPTEIREAARIDGATEWQTYRKVIIPLLNPVTISTAIILMHVSLKIFDLIFAMSGVGPGFATDVPGIFVFEMMFKAARYNLGAAASQMMLFFSCIIIVPYLLKVYRERPDG